MLRTFTIAFTIDDFASRSSRRTADWIHWGANLVSLLLLDRDLGSARFIEKSPSLLIFWFFNRGFLKCEMDLKRTVYMEWSRTPSSDDWDKR